MIVTLVGYKNMVLTNKTTGEQYNAVRAYVLCDGTRNDVDQGKTCQALFYRCSTPQSLEIWARYELETDVSFFNGQPQLRVTGLKFLPDESDPALPF